MTARLAAFAGMAATILAPFGARAQDARTDVLQRVEESISNGRFTQARTLLGAWLAANPTGSDRASPDQNPRALMLRGRLATQPDSAHEAYLSLVLSYPSSSFTPEALLRLGQGRLADGDAKAALQYLQRLISDHPTSPHQPAGLLWIARARGAAGDWPGACETVRAALAGTIRDIEIATLLRAEAEDACSRTAEPIRRAPIPDARRPIAAADTSRAVLRADTSRAVVTRDTSRDLTLPEAARADRSGARPPVLPYAVQSAALRSRPNANALAARLRTRGFDARVSLVPGNALLRVRVGKFATAAEAAELARRIRAAGFDAVVVGDARSERPRSRTPMTNV